MGNHIYICTDIVFTSQLLLLVLSHALVKQNPWDSLHIKFVGSICCRNPGRKQICFQGKKQCLELKVEVCARVWVQQGCARSCVSLPHISSFFDAAQLLAWHVGTWSQHFFFWLVVCSNCLCSMPINQFNSYLLMGVETTVPTSDSNGPTGS